MTKELKRITYVEDEPDIRELAQIVLEDMGGFTLNICSSGAEAVDKSPAFQPDLVLLDVMMPGMTGIETFKKMQEIASLRDTPIIFMTAKAQPQEVEQYLSLGAAGVITKPFDPITLNDEIREIWNHSH